MHQWMHPEQARKLGVSPPSGLLLHGTRYATAESCPFYSLRAHEIRSGPSGCGKTLMAHALAAESKLSFISVTGSVSERDLTTD